MTGAPRIGLSAGELSADRLGESLIHALRERWPDASFVGLAGPGMRSAGCQAIARTEQLGVMGLVEVFARLPSLLALRRRLARYFIANPPDVFVGIDAPDFNFGLERRLRRHGVPVAHWVSPSIWAWREKRIGKIKKSVDLMLTLLPFETQLYRRYGIDVEYVGHPFADEIPLRSAAADTGAPVVALLPGSRAAEIRRLLPVFLHTARRCLQQRADLRFVLPVASPALMPLCRQYLQEPAVRDLPLEITEGGARDAMRRSRVVLLASGSATLECLLIKRPMVVAYRLNPISAALVRRMLRVPWVSLPNQLLNRRLVPEFLQEQATDRALASAVLRLLDDPVQAVQQTQAFETLHPQLRCGAADRAAAAIGRRCL